MGYAKQACLVAYTRDADIYASNNNLKDHYLSIREAEKLEKHGEIPNLSHWVYEYKSESYPHYPNKEDQEKYNSDNS